MLQFKNVSKTYEDTNVTALENVNLDIEKGEFVFLVGHSGAGKSTLIKLITAEEQATSGEIIINDIQVNKLKRREIPYYRRTLGMVFQDFRLLDNKTVLENVAFAMKVVGATNRQIRRRAPDVLGRVGLSQKAHFLPEQLSGGEQQRVAIARALANNPNLIIADEPTGNLDPDTSKEIMEYLEEINRSGTTIIVATHDKDIVDSMHKRVIAVDGGTIVRDDERGGYSEDEEF
ncbi:MAG: cell division ATP-binding protein FtsE [Ruminococcaceae bacterium]|nr:cell division ATP-binding protein FtsE [Oscillospiraceae bacterium]